MEQASTFAEAKSNALASLKNRFSSGLPVALAFSGGKDSSALVTFVTEMLCTGELEWPEHIAIIHADTRQEYPSLEKGAKLLLNHIHKKTAGRIKIYSGSVKDLKKTPRSRVDPADQQFLIYILGRGVVPPSNTFRWCTPKIKQPVQEYFSKKFLLESGHSKMLSCTGVRHNESAARDTRIQKTCSTGGTECGLDWFQEDRDKFADVLAPLVSWRYCHVVDWLTEAEIDLGYPVWPVFETYGMRDEDGPNELRTGCNGCPLVQKDKGMHYLASQDKWRHLEPFLGLRDLYWEYRRPEHRIRKWGERNKVGAATVSSPDGCRMGPLTMSARQSLESQILEMQKDSLRIAKRIGVEPYTLLHLDQLERIHELRAANTWPERWTGNVLAEHEFFRLVKSFDCKLPTDFLGVEIPAHWQYPKIFAASNEFERWHPSGDWTKAPTRYDQLSLL